MNQTDSYTPSYVGYHQNLKTKIMRKNQFFTLFLSLYTAAATAQMTDNTVMVGGEAMFPQKNIIENAVNSAQHTTLVTAVKAAGLVETLSGPGPFTVFAPVNDAFENLPAGTVESLMKPDKKAQLTAVLTYHVVPGRYDFDALTAEIKKGKGTATLKTAQGGMLRFTMNGKHNIMVWDENGSKANISVYDVYQKNGVIHVIDAVLLPKM
ncbi:MAG: fasciclin domain-containing protein [Chitinophagales bacterium]|nr:fasciclin domain-containing protein [Chitinophagales bacterium]MDW8394195.1 fasciclin domain-containing protein [Chitinophagales bacterium]